jgi:hypothetical protein
MASRWDRRPPSRPQPEVWDLPAAIAELIDRGLPEDEASVRVAAYVEWREQNGLRNGWVRQQHGFDREEIETMERLDPASCTSCDRRYYWTGPTCALCDSERMFWPGEPGDRAYEARFGKPRPEWMGGRPRPVMVK